MFHKFLKKYHFIDSFDINLLDKINPQIGIIYRNYDMKILDFNKLKKIKYYLKKRKVKFYIANNVRIAVKLNLDGVYIPSFNHNFSHLSYNLNDNFTILGSAHNLKEIKLKELQNIKEIFISPLFKDKTNKQLSIYRYLKLKHATYMKDISLGGINEKNIKKLKLIKPCGFAGISFFDKKKGP